MKLKTILIAGVVILLIVVIAKRFATSSAPRMNASAQNHKPSKADRSTPKASLLAMSEAIMTGDAQTYLDSFVFSTPDEFTLKANLHRVILAIDRFKAEARTKFGAEATDANFPNLPVCLPKQVIERATETITGETASVNVGRVSPIEMTQLEGEWKTSVNGFFQQNAGALNNLVVPLGRGLEEASVGIREGKFASFRDALMALKQKSR